MQYSDNDWIKAATKLLEMTSKGKVEWELTDEYDEDAWDVIDRAFAARIKDNRFVVKAARRREFFDGDIDQMYWSGMYLLEVYRRIESLRWQKIATAPRLNIISDLYETIEANYAHQMGALDDLLGGSVFD